MGINGGVGPVQTRALISESDLNPSPADVLNHKPGARQGARTESAGTTNVYLMSPGGSPRAAALTMLPRMMLLRGSPPIRPGEGRARRRKYLDRTGDRSCEGGGECVRIQDPSPRPLLYDSFIEGQKT